MSRSPKNPQKKATCRIAVLVQVNLAYSRDVLTGISHYMREFPQWSLQLVTHAAQLIPMLDELDGVLGYIDQPAQAGEIVVCGLPAVTVASCRAFAGCASLHSDESAVGALAAEHFLDRGFRHFAMIGLSGSPFSRNRQAGFADALRAAEATTTSVGGDLQTSNTTAAEDDRQLLEFLTQLPTPCGVFCITDWLAHRVGLVAKQAGRRIPEDIALVGVDNDVMICDFTDPPISSVQQSTERIGYEACELLAELLAGKPVPTKPQLVSPRGVVVRQSSDILAVDDPLVAQAVAIIHSHPAGQVELADVFEQVPLSRRMLELRFKKALGRTVQEEIWRRRVERIRYLLANTDRSLKQIAADVGFAYVSYLTTFFKKHTGLTPSQFRKQARPAIWRMP